MEVLHILTGSLTHCDPCFEWCSGRPMSLELAVDRRNTRGQPPAASASAGGDGGGGGGGVAEPASAMAAASGDLGFDQTGGYGGNSTIESFAIQALIPEGKQMTMNERFEMQQREREQRKVAPGGGGDGSGSNTKFTITLNGEELLKSGGGGAGSRTGKGRNKFPGRGGGRGGNRVEIRDRCVSPTYSRARQTGTYGESRGERRGVISKHMD